ncbi:unnamed protein product [Adineta steineri]|uniref:Uncharacterized protein n=2 Tax=Adineta steineri TaxID=433720 RepID=A0A815GP93_9BILA|nr:unnamed protein product [Adineta steineri]
MLFLHPDCNQSTDPATSASAVSKNATTSYQPPSKPQPQPQPQPQPKADNHNKLSFAVTKIIEPNVKGRPTGYSAA